MTKTDPKIEEQFLKLYDEGFSDEEIADRIGKTKSTIGKWRKKRNLPTVFENRKRLTSKETQLIQDYLFYERRFRRIKNEETILVREKGLTAFVMTLKHQLGQISQADVENYVIANNAVDLTRRNELLRTKLVKQFTVPNIPITTLYNFASTIIAKRIFWRDGCCTKCKSLTQLHLHFLAGEFNLLDENLTTLCENCIQLL